MYFLHAINSDRQTRLLNVLGRIADWEINKKSHMKLKSRPSCVREKLGVNQKGMTHISVNQK